MRSCVVCGSYTLLESHCEKATRSAHPARFNPRDPYARYRRIARFGFA